MKKLIFPIRFFFTPPDRDEMLVENAKPPDTPMLRRGCTSFRCRQADDSVVEKVVKNWKSFFFLKMREILSTI